MFGDALGNTGHIFFGAKYYNTKNYQSRSVNLKSVNHAKPKDKIYSLADQKGLYLKIKPSGYKAWMFNYFTPFTKKRLALTLGEYPIITPTKARAKRDEYRQLLLEDIDPIEHEREKARIIAGKKRTYAGSGGWPVDSDQTQPGI